MNQEIRLDEMRPGEIAIVRALHTEGTLRRRLQDIGLIEGTVVECIGRSPSGDPHAYLIRGAVIAIRAANGKEIMVTPLTAGEV